MKRLRYDRRFSNLSVQPMQKRFDTARLLMLQLMFAAGMLLIIIRLFFLQVVQGSEMRARSDNNRIFERSLVASRGVIVDRNGESLALNQTVPVLITDEKGNLLVEPEVLNREEELALQASASGRLGQDVQRYYPEAEVLAHVIGYVGEATAEEVEAGEFGLGQVVGRSGLEVSFDSALTGTVGSELVETDAGGHLLRRVVQTPAEPGLDVELYVDVGLQRALHQALDGRPGAAVATNPQTGEVLALVSTPSFDPNVFIQGEYEQVSALFSDDSLPMMNRAIGGVYPPGSVYKVVPSIAGLETGVIQFDTEVEDEGQIVIDEYSYRNWYFTKYGRTDGLVDVRKALQRSNDIYYYKLAEWLGPEELARWSRDFGLGSITGIELLGEAEGLVPTPIWKERTKAEIWYLGNTYHFGIGQGDLLSTPLQMNQMMGVFASEGRWCTPRLVKRIGDGEETGVECRQLQLSPEHMKVVREGLEMACLSGGTAFPFFDFDLSQFGEEYAGEGRSRVACKTGTAQFFDPEDRTHAWFSVFAPAVNPEIQITVLVEAAGEGSEQAAPVAKTALEYWFSEKQ